MNANAHDAIEKRIERLARQLHIADISRLRRALTHKSYLNENPFVTEDNERLEFLGDAVLDFVVADWLYNHCIEMDEGAMTRTRAALVRNDRLASFAQQLELGEALRMGRGEENNGGRERPAMLGSAFEAVVGALYLDQGLDAVRDFMQPFIEATFDEVTTQYERLDPKSHLQIYTQGQHMGTPTYHIIEANGPDHRKLFRCQVRLGDQVLGEGEGTSKHQAEENAALQALKNLEAL